MKDSYSILKKIVEKSHNGERANAILSSFENWQEVIIDYFSTDGAEDGNPNDHDTRHNFYSTPCGIDKSKHTLVFLAHHDTVNYRADNVLDNTSSVSNLIALNNRLIGQKDLTVNIVIAITDAEEIMSFTGSGAVRLAKKIKSGMFGEVIETVNLELTAYGDIIWADGDGCIADKLNLVPVKTPYSDTAVLMRQGIKSTVIGIFSHDDLREYNKTGYCKNWRYCHSDEDKLELASPKDMDNFVKMLENYAESLLTRF